jgi:hypothetical protein
MHKFFSFILLAIIGASGCAETYTLSRYPTPENIAEARKRCDIGDNCIAFRNGLEVTAARLRLTADSVFWQAEDSTWHGARCQDVERITHSDHSRGMLDGTACGVGAGAALGLMFAIPASAQHSRMDVFNPFMAVPALAAVGIIPGVLIGAAVGLPTVMEFDTSRETPRLSLRNSAGWSTPGQSDSTDKH